MPTLSPFSSSEALLRRVSQTLYRCLEEIGSTKASLYLLHTEDMTFHLVAHYGWPRHTPPPAILHQEDSLILWVLREREAFIVNDPRSFPELGPFAQGAPASRFLVAPIYNRGRCVGILLQRDRNQGMPYDVSRDCPLTRSICQEISETVGGASGETTGQATPEPPSPLHQSPFPVQAPPSASMANPQAPETVGHGEPADAPRKLLAGAFLPEQRTFFWELAAILSQVISLDAVALWMEEATELRPILLYSHGPLSDSLKREVQTALAGQMQKPVSEALRLHPRAEAPTRELLEGTFMTLLPVILEEETGARDLLLLCRLREQPFTESEMALIKRMARLAGCHLQEARLHERYHRAFLSVSQRILGSAQGLRAHSLNTARLARNLALRLNLPSPTVEAIGIAAILHDVGSLLLAPELREKSNLSPEELIQVRTHPVLATTFLRDFQFPFDVPTIIRHHHEWWDGSGYPDGLKAEEIPIGSRIIAVIEAYEVMSAGTAYRAALDKEHVLEELRRGAGNQFDPTLIQEFMALKETPTR